MVVLILHLNNNEDTVVSKWSFSSQALAKNGSVKIAFITDLHIRDRASDFDRLDNLIQMVNNQTPDLILLGGDYTGEGLQTNSNIRHRIIDELERLTRIAPTYAVLGNHEWWTDGDWWRIAINNSSIDLVEGSVQSIKTKGGKVCLRGLGDAYTGYYRSVPFGDRCKGVRITLTHDPYAVERDSEGGLYLAGHTHCGQVRLPLIGAPWAPTAASEGYHCGSGSSDDRVWIVSAGVGTSVLPVRFRTQSSVELITIARQ